MNRKHIVVSTVALAGVAFLLIPATLAAHGAPGPFLDTTQRDFRVFNNFTAPEANNNVTPDPDFPGYTGATLAIWKACTEWGSQLHAGSGNGDPHQPGDLGSGGANFDAVFQGNANSIGGVNDNTFSELNASSTGALCYTETPISDGWRIRFYANWLWSDGPDTPGQVDLQGLACTAYGIALGLNYNNISGSTMNGTLSGNGSNRRSLAPVDIAAVQSWYGVVDPLKPRITGISYSAGTLTIQGMNFGPTANQVWFTPSAPTAPDVPVRVFGLPSNGTQITLSVPPNAGSGDVFVKVAGTTNASLSNGWPIDSAGFPPLGTAYCFGDGSLPTPCPCVLPNTVPNPSGAPDAGCANSFDLDGAKLTAAGGTTPDSVTFTVVIGGNTAAFAFLLKGNASDANGVANGDGVRCVDGQLLRFGSHNAGTNGAPLGTWTYPNSAQTIPVSSATLQQPGQSAYYQLFYRNNAPAFCTSATTNMSNGFQIPWP